MGRMSLASRLPAALIITLLTAIALTGAIAVAGAPDADEGPQRFHRPAQMEGDQWSYEVRVFEGSPDAPGDAEVLERWGREGYWDAPRPVRMPDGDYLSIQAKRSNTTFDRPDGPVTLAGHVGFDMAAGRLRTDGGGGLGSRGGYSSTLGLLWSGHSSQHLGNRTTWIDEDAACLIAAMQEQTWRVPGPLPTCDGDEAPRQAVGFEDTEAGRLLRVETPNGSTNWYAQEVPVPVITRHNWTDTSGSSDGTTSKEGYIEHQLTGWASGFVPLGRTIPVPAGQAVAPARLAPLQPWGMDDSDIDHPYPPSRAWQDAATNPTFPDLRDFLQEYDDARTIQTWFDPWQRGDRHGGYHWFWIVGGDEMLHLMASYEVDSSATTATGGLLGEATTVRVFADQWASRDATTLVAPDDYPTHGPTVGSLFARWQEFAPADDDLLPPGTWSFEAYCSRGSCDEWSRVRFAAGPAASPPQDLLGFVQEAEGDGDGFTVWTDAQGTLVQAMRSTHQWQSGTTLSQQDPWQPPATRGGDSSVPLLAGWASAWPGSPAAAGIGFLSLVIGAFYYVWLALKSFGATGLFSRVTPDAARGHPTRQAILATVHAEPGIHHEALGRRLSVRGGTLDHHLRVLQQHGEVRRRRVNGYTCYVATAADATAAARGTATRSAGAGRVVAHIDAAPGASTTDIARATGLAPSTVSHHLARLESAGAIQRSRQGRLVRAWPTAA